MLRKFFTTLPDSNDRLYRSSHIFAAWTWTTRNALLPSTDLRVADDWNPNNHRIQSTGIRIGPLQALHQESQTYQWVRSQQMAFPRHTRHLPCLVRSMAWTCLIQPRELVVFRVEVSALRAIQHARPIRPSLSRDRHTQIKHLRHRRIIIANNNRWGSCNWIIEIVSRFIWASTVTNQGFLAVFHAKNKLNSGTQFTFVAKNEKKTNLPTNTYWITDMVIHY